MHRLFVSLALRIAGLIALTFATGCAFDSAPPVVDTGESIGQQLRRTVPSLKESRFSTLLDFESASDSVFVATSGGAGRIVTDKAHTGRYSFQMDAVAKRFTVKLPALLAGRPFPASWTLVGGYVYAERAARINVSLEPAAKDARGRLVELTAGEWTPVFVEVPPANASDDRIPQLVFASQSSQGRIWFDDIVLVDNAKVLNGPAEPSSPQSMTGDSAPQWTIVRRGFTYIGESPGLFSFTLVTAEASASGWTVEEANPMRARFRSMGSGGATGGGKILTVYYDGRAYWDGRYRPMSASGREPTYADQHQSPAQIEVAEGMGRVDRNTPGDANNDGYNETTGSYRIQAAAIPRVELRLIPKSSPLLRPILEFSGLPIGKALVTLEGRLVEQSARTSSGTVLVELPAKIDRPVTVDLRIEE